MKNLTERLITGVFLIATVLISIFTSAYSFMLLILIINILGLSEFYKLFSSYSPYKIAGLIVSTILFISSSLIAANLFDWKILLLNIPSTFSLYIIALYSKSKNPFAELAFTFLGIIYITIPFIFLTIIAFLPLGQNLYNPYILLGLFLIVWTNDSGAYAIGSLFGKNRLFERVSPNKTWEGSLGGAMCSLLIAYIISFYFVDLTLADWMLIALIVIIVGTYGDFIKSLLKRSLNVKDSGKILPGHGGILDRFDSIIGSSPFVFCYLLFN